MSKIDNSKVHLQQQNQALANKRTQRVIFTTKQNLTNKEKLKLKKKIGVIRC